MARICRVFVNPDNTLRIVHAVEEVRLPGEKDKEFYERVFSMAIEGDVSLQGLEFFDTPVTNIPARDEPCDDVDCTDKHSVRDQWRADKVRKKLRRDTSVPQVYKEIDHLQRDMEIEEDKPNPDPLKLLALQAKLRSKVRVTKVRLR